MPTWDNVAQIATAMAVIVSAYLSWRNGKKIDVIHAATNGMKSELVAAVRGEAVAVGNAQGRADLKEEQRHP
jgi:hypothetical protein